MALSDSRVIYKQGSNLNDLSSKLSDLHAGSAVIPLVSGTDRLYFGSDVPFNHRFIWVDVANDLAATIASIEIWNGNEWVPCVDVIDRTASGGKTLAQSGVVEWMPDRRSYWNVADSTEDIPDLATIKIYSKYWARFNFSADIKPETALKYVGQRFSADSDLGGMYPDLLRATNLSAFKTGKTDWNEQHVLAAEEIVNSLKRDFLVWAPGQVLDWQRFTLTACHKVAEIIFRAFGDDFVDERAGALRDFAKSLERTGAGIDRDRSGRLSTEEKKPIKRIIRI